MLKKIVKTAIFAVAALGLSSSTMAETKTKLGATVGMYFGQLDMGKTMGTADALPAFFDYAGEFQLNFDFENGPFSGSIDLKTRTDFTNVTDDDASDGSTNYYKNTYIEPPNGQLRYTAGNATVKLGYMFTAIPFSYKSGMKNLEPVKSQWPQAANWCCSADTGVGVDYYVKPRSKDGFIKLAGVLYASDTINDKTGQTTEFAADAKFGAVGVRATMTSATYEDILTKDTEGWNSTQSFVGAKYTIMKGMSVSLDVQSKEAALSKDDSKKTTANALQFKMGIGPGSVIATYTAIETTRTDQSKYKETDNRTNLVYDIPVAKKSGFQILYLARDLKKTSKTGVSSDAAASFIGGGMYAKF